MMIIIITVVVETLIHVISNANAILILVSRAPRHREEKCLIFYNCKHMEK